VATVGGLNIRGVRGRRMMAESVRPGTLPDREATLIRRLAWRERVLLFPFVHAALYALRWVGMRDRLRCPQCNAVGTFKPHGTLTARWLYKDRATRRYMCKWCGLYIGPEGVLRAFPDPARKCWVLPQAWDTDSPSVPGLTPADVTRDALNKTWPWYG
jgi:hypothetical protein